MHWRQRASLFWKATVTAFAVVGCSPNARWYEPVTPLRTRGPSTELEAKTIRRESAHTLVQAGIHPIFGDPAFGRPRLTTPDAPPCASGENAGTWTQSLTVEPERHEPGMHGALTARFSNARADPGGLLLTRPTVLDVPVMIYTATNPPASTCLRLPLLVTGAGAAEWRQAPRWWLGVDLFVEVPVHRIAGIGSTVLMPISFGALAGPVRLGLQLGYGFGFGPETTRTIGLADVLEAGFLVDSPLLVIRRFGTGLKLAYEVEGWALGRDKTTNEAIHATVHGPRAALRFLLLPPPPPSSKYDARSDTWSTGIEFSASLRYLVGDGTPTPTIGGSYFGDIGW